MDFSLIAFECDRLYSSGQPAKVGVYLQEQLDIARRQNDIFSEVRILSELAGHYRMQREYAVSTGFASRAVDLLNNSAAADKISRGTILLNCATAFQAGGDVTYALELFEQVRELYAALPDKDHPLRAGLYNNMASALITDGKYREAETAYLNALDILKKHRNFADSAVTCINLAQLYVLCSPDDPLIGIMLDAAAAYFDDPAAERNSYYAHSCQKCAAAFEFFDRAAYGKELETRAKEIYERN